MTTLYKELAVRGKSVRVPTAQVDGRAVIVTGRFVRVASIHDAALLEGEPVANPGEFAAQLAASGLKADLLTFSQRIYEEKPKHAYAFEWDNVAAACTTSYSDWWDGLPQTSRKNVRRAGKRGVVVQQATFDAQFVRGVKDIYDETPVRQGRRFWHFGKDLETIRAENSSYLERSEFIGAYHDGELIGFMKFVYVDKVAMVMQILAKESHYDKRPMNALIAKAVEICHQKGMSYLVYSKFTYGKKTQSDIAEFKQRNGFSQMNFPKYFVPLTLRGRIAFALNVHRGVLELLPSGVIHFLLLIRSRLLNRSSGRASPAQMPEKAPISPGEGSEVK